MWIKAFKNKHNKGYYIGYVPLAHIIKSIAIYCLFGNFSDKSAIIVILKDGEQLGFLFWFKSYTITENYTYASVKDGYRDT